VSDERWARIGELFHELAGQARVDQQARLTSLGEEDPELAHELVALLRADAARSPLDGGAQGMVAALGAVAPAVASSAEGPSPRLVGQRLGAWQLVAPLGKGGMGVVYLAERAEGGFTQRAAVKVLRQSVDSPELQRRFLGERQLLAGLDHAAIVRLLDGGVTPEGLPWFALELVDGRPITLYARERRLSVRQRVALMVEVCTAVEAAHRRLVVHRDLKPSNILVTGQGRVKLLDFGIAKVIAEVEEPASTRTEHRLLTPQYAAPEQILGEPVTVAVDVYALGVVLYELLAGVLPHERKLSTAARLAKELAGERTVAPSERLRALGGEANRERAEVAGDLDAVVLMALRAEPERRYASVAALGEDLSRFLDHRPVTARTSDRAYRAARFVRRHRVVVTVVALFMALLVAALAGALWQARAARERSWEDRLALTQTLDQLAGVEARDGRFAAARVHAKRQLALAQGLARERPRDARAVRAVAAARRSLATAAPGERIHQ
jgi:serine/threonine-protein kinase